jgi:hypothetical protein
MAKNRSITSQPDSMQPSASVNSAPNMPPPAMSQDLYSASVQMQMQNRRDALRAHGAKNGKPFLPAPSTVNIPGHPIDEQ